MGVEEELADSIVDAEYENLPKEGVDILMAGMLDVVGTIITGAGVEKVEDLVRLVKDWTGKKEATILVYGGKVPAHNAVLVNSYMARALDYESVHIPGCHFLATLVPVALAAAELRG